MVIQFRPIHQWPRPFTKVRRKSPFLADYNDTLDKLEYEIAQLKGKNVVIQLAITEGDIRNDGWPRASARPSHPGVIVSFDSGHGPLTFVCDEFENGNGRVGWQANLRGIAMTLERLRLADLYGVTKSGEQYTGWKALPAAQEVTPEEEAATLLCSSTRMQFSAEHIRKVLSDPEYFKQIYRLAAQQMHPDNGGQHDLMQRVNAAADILKRRHGL